MSKSVVTAASAGRSKALSRAKVLREKENNHKPAAEEAAAATQHDAQAAELAPAHAAELALSDTALAGDFSFAGVMADAAASADFTAASAGFAGMAGLAQDSGSDSDGSGGGFGGSTPILIGAVVAAGLGVAAAVSSGDDDDDGTPTPTPPTPTPNSAPTFTGSTLTGAGNEDAKISGKLAATDANSDTLTFALKSGATAPAGFTLKSDGSYELDASNTAYQSLGEGKTQTVTIPVTVTDGKSTAVDANLTITVTGKNDAPTVTATQAITTDENVARTFTVAGTDVDGDTLTYAVGATAAKNGTVAVGTNGSLTYTPNAGFDGTDSFTVNVSDGKGGTATQTVNVTVNNVGPTNAAITVNAAGSVTDADNVNTTYTVQQGNYAYTITGFDAIDADGGDKLVSAGGVTPTVINGDFGDGKVDLQFASPGNIVTVTIAGLTAAQDSAIVGLNSFKNVFGAGSVA